MRGRRYQRIKETDSTSSEFIEEIQQEIDRKGMVNGICILLGEEGELNVLSANPDNSIQLAGMIDLGKTCFHNDVLGGDE